MWNKRLCNNCGFFFILDFLVILNFGILCDVVFKIIILIDFLYEVFCDNYDKREFVIIVWFFILY